MLNKLKKTFFEIMSLFQKSAWSLRKRQFLNAADHNVFEP